MQTRSMFEFAARRELPVVLLIDDDLVSREVTATLLTMTGYSVHTAENGPASLKMLAGGDFKPGAILMVLGELLEGREPDLGSKLRFG